VNNKWETLVHNGPLFPPEYEYKQFDIRIAGADYTLSPLAEEMVYAWAQKHNTDYIKDKLFQKNFWSSLKPELEPKFLQHTKFPEEWDFSNIINYIEQQKELKKLKTKEQKEAEKLEKEKLREQYGYAVLDGQKIALGAYMIEPPSLFMGRGDHPLRGSWKRRVLPEDVIINATCLPVAPTGHKWKKIVMSKTGLWTSSWQLELLDKPKHIMFAGDSIVKQSADQKKFQKAIKLAQNFDYVQSAIDKALLSGIESTRKIATVTKLIAQLSIRVGDEKGEDEADTVGATSLRVEHIKILDNNQIQFDFLGKDSVPYHNVATFDPQVIKNIQENIKGKKPDDRIFNRISSLDVNQFLGNILEGITAKTFRTAYGSLLLAQALSKEDVSNKSTSQKLLYFTTANLEVAKKLNHHAAVSKAQKESAKKIKDTLKGFKAEYKDMLNEFSEIKKNAKLVYDQMVIRAKTYKGERKKISLARAKQGYEHKISCAEKKLKRLENRILNIETKLEIKQKTEGIALGTSKQNYCDSKIIVSFCKKNELDINKVYNKALQKKFEWALNAEPDYYLKYPNVDK
jgi:DNA topoisomerase-1